jgi:ferredoxin
VRQRTRQRTPTRTKHDFTQSKTFAQMQHHNNRKTGQKTHLHRQQRNTQPHIRSHRKPRPKILSQKRKMPKRRELKIKRKIVSINEDLCNGCGACIPKCVEGALQIVQGKAKIVKDTYCDGLGACLGHCPQGAITIIERDAEAFNEQEVHEYQKSKENTKSTAPSSLPSQKPQWPVKLDLVPPKAPFFENATILFAADCAPVVLKNFHEWTTDKRVIIGCPKFNDAPAYAQKLTEIFQKNNIASVVVMHMEVPCCTGLLWAVNKALEASGKKIPVKEYEVKVGGEVIEL